MVSVNVNVDVAGVTVTRVTVTTLIYNSSSATKKENIPARVKHSEKKS